MPELTAFQIMSNIRMSDDIDIVDPKLRGLAKRVLAEFQLASEKAVAHLADPGTYKMPADTKSVEHLLLARLKSLPPLKQELACLKVMSLVKAKKALREEYFGGVASISLLSSASVLQQAAEISLPVALKLTPGEVGNLALAPTGLIPQQAVSKLALRLHRVTCVDETDPEWGGSDTIALAGVGVGPSGASKLIKEFKVGDFDDGDVKAYPSPNFKSITDFNLAEGGSSWPKTFFANLVLAEKDNGAFPNFVLALLNAIRDRVAVVVAGAAGGAIGGSLAGPIGAAIGAAVGWILGKFIQWLVDWWNDDVFPPRTVSVTLPSVTHRWLGNKHDSPDFHVWFVGHGGIYKLTCDWRLVP